MSPRFLLLAILVAGCGGKAIEDDTNSTDAASNGDVSIPADGNISVPTDAGPMDYCKAASERATRCMSDTFSLTQCQEQLACYQRALRPEAYTPFLTCLANRPCGTADDRCVAESAQKYITDPVVQDWVKTCNEKRNACTGAFSDDYCGYEFGLFNDTLRANVKTCLSRSCAEVRTCFNTVFAAVGCSN